MTPWKNLIHVLTGYVQGARTTEVRQSWNHLEGQLPERCLSMREVHQHFEVKVVTQVSVFVMASY